MNSGMWKQDIYYNDYFTDINLQVCFQFLVFVKIDLFLVQVFEMNVSTRFEVF